MSAWIRATGTFENKPLTVSCVEDGKDLVFLFNNHFDSVKEKRIKDEMKKRHIIAGSFSPEEHSMLNIKNVLEFYFFDELVSLEVEGDIGELPYEEGVVY